MNQGKIRVRWIRSSHKCYTLIYLKDKDTEITKNTGTLQEQNITLNTLNNFLTDLENLIGAVTTIAGNDQGTVGEITVAEQNPDEDPLWRDGKPDPIDPNRNNAAGDNRVLLSSAHIQPILDQATLADSKHGDLPSKAGSELFLRLGFADPGTLALVNAQQKAPNPATQI